MKLVLLSALLLATACSPSGPRAAPWVAGRSTSLEDTGAPEVNVKSSKILPYPDNKAQANVIDTIFGTVVSDPYRWLEDVSKPEVTQWLDAQDQLARSELKKLPERDAIAGRLKELFYVDSLGAPLHRGDRYFFRRRHADKEKAIVYVKTGKAGQEKALLDPNQWSKDGKNVALGNWSPSWDGKLVAYTTHENNSDEATLYLMDVETGKRLEKDTIEGAKYASPSWARDSKGFFYTWLPVDPKIPVDQRPGYADVRFHAIGTEPSKDEVIQPKLGDSTKFVGGELSDDGSTLFLYVHSGWSGNELSFRDPKKKGEWIPLSKGFASHYYADAFKGVIYVMTDDGAARYRIFAVDPKKPERAAWKQIVAEHPTATLEGFNVVGGKLVLRYLDKAASKVFVHKLDGALEHELKLPGIGSATIVGRSDESILYYGFESFTTPFEIHEVDLAGHPKSVDKLYSQVKVNVDRDRFVVEQVTYRSKDGTPVTMFLIHDKNLKKDGNARVLYYGYGGFQISETPSFTSSIFPWIERGGIYAVANLRGGGEYGEAWHKDGMLLKKQNVFDDYIAGAEYLVKEKYTSPSHIAIMGGSNGGLLVGAAMTQRPDLFGAVLCSVPLLDMVRYHQFGSGRTWISEYGSSEKEPEFRALFGYSPYHRVKSGTKYPALLMLTADSDDRVDPLHARKFSAYVQDASTGGPVLVRVEKDAGHGGADMRKAEVEKGADRLAFALAHTR